MNIGGYGAYDAPTMPSRPGGPIGPQPMAGPPVSGETPVGPTGSLPGVYPGTGVSGPSSKVNVPGPGPTGVGNVGPTGPSSRPDKPRPGPAYPRSNTWPQTGSGPPLASSNADPLSHAANVRDAYVGYGQDPVVPILPMLIYPGPVGRAGGPVGRADVRGYVGRQI